jgi:hypothetical protein
MAIFSANAVLRFVVFGSSSSIDPETGNPMPEKTEISVQASLSPSAPGRSPVSVQQEIPGVNPIDIFLTGRAISPQVLPVSLLKGGKGTIELTDPASGNKIKGEFLMMASIPSKYSLTTQLLGYRIEGFMQNIGGIV